MMPLEVEKVVKRVFIYLIRMTQNQETALNGIRERLSIFKS